MRLKYLSEDNLMYLKENSLIIYRDLLCGDKSLDDIVDLEESGIEIEPFELIINSENTDVSNDAENVQRIYGHLRMLTLSQAADERLWVAYTLGVFVDYMLKRWGAESDGKWKTRYFFDNSQQRSLYRNGIARLWWIGHAAYDEKRDDPYELVRMVCSQQYLIDAIIEPNFSSNPIFCHAVLNAVFDAKNDGIIIDRTKIIRPLSRYINLQLGTYVLDILSYDEIYVKIRSWLESQEVRNHDVQQLS